MPPGTGPHLSASHKWGSRSTPRLPRARLPISHLSLEPRRAVPLPRGKGTKARRASPLTHGAGALDPRPYGARLKQYASDTAEHREAQGSLFAKVLPRRSPCCGSRKSRLPKNLCRRQENYCEDSRTCPRHQDASFSGQPPDGLMMYPTAWDGIVCCGCRPAPGYLISAPHRWGSRLTGRLPPGTGLHLSTPHNWGSRLTPGLARALVIPLRRC